MKSIYWGSYCKLLWLFSFSNGRVTLSRFTVRSGRVSWLAGTSSTISCTIWGSETFLLWPCLLWVFAVQCWSPSLCHSVPYCSLQPMQSINTTYSSCTSWPLNLKSWTERYSSSVPCAPFYSSKLSLFRWSKLRWTRHRLSTFSRFSLSSFL